MKKTGKRKAATVAEFLETPSPMASPQPDESPDLVIFHKSSSVAKNDKARPNDIGDSSHKTLTSISDLKDFISSRLDDLKRRIDHSYSEILKDHDASQSRLQKRLKAIDVSVTSEEAEATVSSVDTDLLMIQTQACQQAIDEAEKEYKKVSERVTENRKAMKASYQEFIGDAHGSASSACKTSITELAQSFQKSIDSIRSRYGISST